MPRTGRPRAFDRQTALEAAMTLFWERGFEGTSLADLTAALGVNRPSLYAAFGNKEALFAEALAHYEAVAGAEITRLLEEAPTARAALEATLRHNARTYAAEGRPRGCMIVLGQIVGAPESGAVRALLSTRRRAGEQEIRRRIERGQREGDVAAGLDAGRLAAFFTAVLQGMSVAARDGATAADLDGIVDAAMTCWPSESLPGSGGRRASP